MLRTEDGFTAGGPFGVARWGDYSSAYADEAGIIWTGTECIPGGPRSSLANWGPCISPVSPYGSELASVSTPGEHCTVVAVEIGTP